MFCVREDESRAGGDLGALMAHIKDGADVKVVVDGNYSFETSKVWLADGVVSVRSALNLPMDGTGNDVSLCTCNSHECWLSDCDHINGLGRLGVYVECHGSRIEDRIRVIGRSSMYQNACE